MSVQTTSTPILFAIYRDGHKVFTGSEAQLYKKIQQLVLDNYNDIVSGDEGLDISIIADFSDDEPYIE